MRKNASLWKSLRLIKEREKLLTNNITLNAGNRAFMPKMGAKKMAVKNPLPTPAKPLMVAAVKATATM